MLKFRKLILNIILYTLFKRKVYVSQYVQSAVKLQLIICLGDKFILVKDGDRIKLPSAEIDLDKKHSTLLTVKNLLRESVSKKINASTFLELSLLDSCREIVNTEDEKSLFVDDFYIKLSLDKAITEKDLLDTAILCTADDVKLLQFKNKFNSLDYKVILKSQKENGVCIK